MIEQFAAQLAAQAGQEAIGEILDSTFGELKRERQLKQQSKLTDIQLEASKKLSNHQQELQKNMWDYTNYENQRKHIEAAGLNPAMIYGHAGISATTGSPGGTVSGATASDEASQTNARMQAAGMGMQLRINEAQTKLMEAQAIKAQAEAEKTAGIDTVETQTRINQINADIEVLKADEALKNSQNELNKLQQISIKIANEFNEENNLELLKQSTSLSKKLLAEAQVSEQSVDTILATLKTNLSNLLMDIAYKKSNIKLNDANIKNILNNITISNKKITIDENKLTNDWNIAVLNNKSGKIVQDVKGVTDALIKTLRWIGIEVKEDKDFDYQEIK